ncbi:MAG: ribonuclease [Caldilineaceae bacterium]|nr:ribonuclease [Caldilineaceae bacterium]
MPNRTHLQPAYRGRPGEGANSTLPDASVASSAQSSTTDLRAPSGMPVVLAQDLPPEAQETIDLIHQGGPFPFSKDGSTFQNREGLLPAESMGYYAEYTVITPGSSDRGARRIVAGAKGELYYTADHYASFSWVEE